MKKYIILIFLLQFFFINNNLVAATNSGITNEIYIKLCGVWDLRILAGVETSFSWGKARAIINGSVVIDLGDDDPFILAGPMGRSDITKVYKVNDKYIINILFRDNNEYTLEITYNKGSTIIFHEMKWFKQIPLLLNEYGPKYIYNKISGPTIKYYKPKTSTLRLRSEPSQKGNILRLLEKEEKLLLIKRGQEETIDRVKGTWIKVITEKDEMGWCFDGYLKAL